MIVPHPSRKRALFIVDIQAGFINDRDKMIIPNVQKLITDGGYDLFVDAVFHADKGSLWDRETGWTFDLSPTVPEIKHMLDPHKTVFITKTEKSVFNENKHLADFLKSRDIVEVHIVGYDINDCVLATANDAFDLGFFTYVIEEAADSSESNELKNSALAILRENEMTNNSSMIIEKREL